MANRQDEAVGRVNLLAARIADLLETAGWYGVITVLSPNAFMNSARIIIALPDEDGWMRVTVEGKGSAVPTVPPLLEPVPKWPTRVPV